MISPSECLFFVVTLALRKENMEPLEYLKSTSAETIAIHQRFMTECAERLVAAAEAMGKAIRLGGKVLIFGNGGSAADAQHMAAEMVGRMLIERAPLPAIALTTDSSNLTALGNDFGFDVIFEKQIRALARRGDVVIAISTSGNSKNVLFGVKAAKEIGCTVIGLTGGSGGELCKMADFSLNASLGKNSSRIQETHIFILHSLVDLTDRYYLK
jgi:D-sedoheptulose 7-phosphate isomerase